MWTFRVMVISNLLVHLATRISSANASSGVYSPGEIVPDQPWRRADVILVRHNRARPVVAGRRKRRTAPLLPLRGRAEMRLGPAGRIIDQRRDIDALAPGAGPGRIHAAGPHDHDPGAETDRVAAPAGIVGTGVAAGDVCPAGIPEHIRLSRLPASQIPAAHGTVRVPADLEVTPAGGKPRRVALVNRPGAHWQEQAANKRHKLDAWFHTCFSLSLRPGTGKTRPR